MQGAERPDDPRHAPGPVGDVDADPPPLADLVGGLQQQLGGSHRRADPGDHRVPFQRRRAVRGHRVEHREPDRQSHRQVHDRVVGELGVQTPGRPGAGRDRLDVGASMGDPFGPDGPHLRVVTCPGQDLELQGVPTRLGRLLQPVRRLDEGGQGRRPIGCLRGLLDEVGHDRLTPLGKDLEQQVMAVADQPADSTDADAGALGDHLQRGGPEPVSGEQVGRCRDDPVPLRLVSGHGVRLGGGGHPRRPDYPTATVGTGIGAVPSAPHLASWAWTSAWASAYCWSMTRISAHFSSRAARTRFSSAMVSSSAGRS